MNDRILEIRLSPKGIKPVRNGHPWIFRNALGAPPGMARVSPEVTRTVLGDTRLVWEKTAPALVCDPGGAPLGWGIYNPVSRLAVRMITGNTGAAIHLGTFRTILERAVARRRSILHQDARGETTAVRLVFGEADGFPGLVADLLGPVLVIQCSGAFAWENRHWIADTLGQLVPGVHVAVQGDLELLERDGISRETAASPGDEDVGDQATSLPGEWEIRELGIPWLVERRGGQKTGYYCDQRENRRRLRDLAAGEVVLDAFCYHGGFALSALAGGARRVVCADSSRPALEMVHRQAQLQGQPTAGCELEIFQGDLFQILRDNGVPGGLEQFSLIVLDPPKLVPARHHRDRGMRGYKDLNLAVFRHGAPGTRVMTFSCSGAISRADFRTAVAWAAADARREVRILETLGQPADHPVPLSFPEAEYLKGFLLELL